MPVYTRTRNMQNKITRINSWHHDMKHEFKKKIPVAVANYLYRDEFYLEYIVYPLFQYIIRKTFYTFNT